MNTPRLGVFAKLVMTLSLLGFALLFSNCSPPLLMGPGSSNGVPFLVVVNGISENLSFMDSPGGQLYESAVPTGQAPNQIYRKGSDVYVVNSLSNSILKYDIDGFSILNEFSTGNGTNPFKMVIADDRIYVSAYLTHQLLIFNLSGGLLENIDLAVLEEGGKTFYPFPQGIATWGDYVFIACMYSEENSAAKTMDPGRVAVYSIPDQNITGYIEASAQNTSAVNIDGDVLYVISSGAYDPDSDGYDESGKIETLDLSAADLSNDLANPAALSLTTMTSGQSFGALEINNDRAWASDLGNGTLYSYDASATPWVEIANQSFPGSFGMAFVPDIVYDAARDELLATEFNGNILYTLDPDSLEKLDEQRVSGNSMDAQFMLLVE